MRRLERQGLIERRRYAEAPPRVEYELTGPGRDLLEPIRALGHWAHIPADTVRAAMLGPDVDDAHSYEGERDGVAQRVGTHAQ